MKYCRIFWIHRMYYHHLHHVTASFWQKIASYNSPVKPESYFSPSDCVRYFLYSLFLESYCYHFHPSSSSPQWLSFNPPSRYQQKYSLFSDQLTFFWFSMYIICHHQHLDSTSPGVFPYSVNFDIHDTPHIGRSVDSFIPYFAKLSSLTSI